VNPFKKPIEFISAKAKQVVEMRINDKSFFGQNIVINQSHIVIDGVNVSENMPMIKVEIIGSCESVSSMAASVYVTESAQTINTQSGDVECKNVFGSVTTMSGDVECGDVSGSVSTMSGDICCNSRG